MKTFIGYGRGIEWASFTFDDLSEMRSDLERIAQLEPTPKVQDRARKLQAEVSTRKIEIFRIVSESSWKYEVGYGFSKDGECVGTWGSAETYTRGQVKEL